MVAARRVLHCGYITLSDSNPGVGQINRQVVPPLIAGPQADDVAVVIRPPRGAEIRVAQGALVKAGAGPEGQAVIPGIACTNAETVTVLKFQRLNQISPAHIVTAFGNV